MAETMAPPRAKFIRAPRAEGSSGHKTTTIDRKTGPATESKPKFIRPENKGESEGENNKKHRTTVVDKKTGEAKDATPLKGTVAPKTEEKVTFLTPEQSARRNELKGKTHPTATEAEELAALNKIDPFHKHDELTKLIVEGKATSADKELVKKIEETEEFRERMKAVEAAELARDLGRAEEAGLIDSRGAFEALVCHGKVGEHLVKTSKPLIESEDPAQKAMGLDMQKDGLLIEIEELGKSKKTFTEKWMGKRVAAIKEIPKANRVGKRLEEIKVQLELNAKARHELSTEHPDLAANQFTEMVTTLFPDLRIGNDEFGKQTPLKAMNDRFEWLANRNPRQRAEFIVQLKKNRNASEMLSEKLAKIMDRVDDANESKDKKKRIAKKTGLILAFAAAMGVLRAMKEEKGGGQMMGH